STTECRFQAVISLVTGVLEDVLRAGGHGNLPAPASREGLRVSNSEIVEQRVLIRPPEARHEMHVLTRTTEGRLSGGVGGLDDERVSFPMATGMGYALPDVLRKMRRAVDRDAAGILDLLR